MHADTVARSTVFPPDTLVWLAFGLSRHCVKKQCGLVGSCFRGRMALDLRLSRVRTGVAAMRQDCNYQLDARKFGRKRDKSQIQNKSWFHQTRESCFSLFESLLTNSKWAVMCLLLRSGFRLANLPKRPVLVECCRDGCPSGRFSHLHRGTLSE